MIITLLGRAALEGRAAGVAERLPRRVQTLISSSELLDTSEEEEDEEDSLVT